jgi:hypothetical protein
MHVTGGRHTVPLAVAVNALTSADRKGAGS